MNELQKNRIEGMEKKFLSVHNDIELLQNILVNFESKLSNYDDLIEYYLSEEWRKDFEDSNKNGFPSPEEMPHGVLSEDGVFNEISNYNELAIRMIKLGAKMLEGK